jgi:hypothetical protein
MLHLTASLDAQAPPRISGLAYGGGVIRPLGAGPTVIDLAGLNLPDAVPLLVDHDGTAVHTVGSTVPTVQAGQLFIAGEIVPGGPIADRLLELLRAKTPLGLSVGVEVLESRRVRDGETATVNGRSLAGPFTLVTKGVLREVSVTPIPADASTGVRLAASFTKQDCVMSTTPTSTPTTTPTDEGFALFVASLGLAPEAVPDEQRPRLEAAYRQQRDLEARLRLAELRASRPTLPVSGGVQRDVGLAAHVLAMAGRTDIVARIYGQQVADRVESDRPRGWSDLARHALLTAGNHDALRLSGVALLQAAFSTTNLPVALTEGLNKLALEAFRETSANWRAVAKTVNVPDFRDAKAIRLSAATKFEAVPPDGELKHGNLAEETFPIQAATYGKLVGLNRTAIVNDDLSLLGELPVILGAEASRLVSDLVFSELAGAGSGFFAANKGNLLTGGTSTLSVDSLSNAIKALRTQKDRDKRLIGFTPTTLVVPAALEGVARQLLNSTEVNRSGDQAPTGNPIPRDIQLVVEPRLDEASTTAWYLFARPSDGALLVAFLNGNEAPIVEPVEPPAERLGLVWRAYLDVGAALGEYRAAVKAAGA